MPWITVPISTTQKDLLSWKRFLFSQVVIFSLLDSDEKKQEHLLQWLPLLQDFYCYSRYYLSGMGDGACHIDINTISFFTNYMPFQKCTFQKYIRTYALADMLNAEIINNSQCRTCYIHSISLQSLLNFLLILIVTGESVTTMVLHDSLSLFTLWLVSCCVLCVAMTNQTRIIKQWHFLFSVLVKIRANSGIICFINIYYF